MGERSSSLRIVDQKLEEDFRSVAAAVWNQQTVKRVADDKGWQVGLSTMANHPVAQSMCSRVTCYTFGNRVKSPGSPIAAEKIASSFKFGNRVESAGRQTVADETR